MLAAAIMGEKMSAEIINLRRARKQRLRTEQEARANENRIRFGLPKADRERLKQERDRQATRLEGHKRELDPDL
ncbi:MAG TPA: DUF4169 family protein [Beijerinckiaceae bacterium]|nr:DUF4169 family protein [Beijerinckiaceae bacterium]